MTGQLVEDRLTGADANRQPPLQDMDINHPSPYEAIKPSLTMDLEGRQRLLDMYDDDDDDDEDDDDNDDEDDDMYGSG